MPASAVYLTGDSWSDGRSTYRLYGVQACLRGTAVTNAHGRTRDCGEASLAMLVALTRDLRPLCRVAERRPSIQPILVVCVAEMRAGAGAGSRLDLGTALIATGFGFAALAQDGRPVHPPYLIAQGVARRARAGLWAFPDFPEPNAIIRGALARARGPAPSGADGPSGAHPLDSPDARGLNP